MYEVVFSFSFAVVVNLSLIVSIVLMVRCCTLKLIYIVNVQSLYMYLPHLCMWSMLVLIYPVS